MGAVEEFVRSRQNIWVFMQAVFNDAKVLDARDWTIHAGIGKYLNQPRPPFGIADTARATALGVVARYALGILRPPAARADTDGSVTGFRFPTGPDDTSLPVDLIPAFLVGRRADLVWDDAAELLACEFPYTAVDTALGRSTRAKVYGSDLGSVKPPADSADTGFFDTGDQFVATAAVRATYDASASGQPYYAKWRAQSPSAAKDRVFDFDHLSDAYLRLNFQAYDLQKGGLHLYLSVGPITALCKLSFDAQGRLGYEVIFSHHLPSVGDLFQLVNAYIRDQRAQNQKVLGNAQFVYALEGADASPKFASGEVQVPASGGYGLHVLEHVVDPQRVVQAAASLPVTMLDQEHSAFRQIDWLKEMVRLRFSDPWVWFWKNAGVQMFYGLDRERLFLADLRDATKKAVGPLKGTLETFLQRAQAEPNLYLVRRGSKYGTERRVIGSDDAFVYFYNNKARLVTRLPMFAFWADVNASQVISEVYENTRGMLPFIKAVTWGGAAVMGWGIIGTEELVNGARQYLGNYVRNKLASAALEELLAKTFKALRERLSANLIFPILELFGIKTLMSAVGGTKIYAFIKGVVEGFTEQAFHTMMSRWVSFFQLEPASYRAIKMMWKLEAIIRWVDEKMSALKDFVTEEVAAVLANRFAAVVVEVGTGFIGLLHAMYYLDYDRARPLLELYAELTGEPVPSQADWDQLRHQQFLQTFTYWEQAVKEEGQEIAELYATTQKYVERARWVAKGVEFTVIAQVASAGGLPRMALMLLKSAAKTTVKFVRTRPGQVAVAGFTGAMLMSDSFRDEVLSFLGVFRDAAEFIAAPAKASLSYALSSEDRLERFGQLMGLIGASLLVSGVVIKREDAWRERWAKAKESKAGKAKLVGTYVKKQLLAQLNVNPMLPALKLALFHYVDLIEQVVTTSRQSFADLEDKIENILLGDPRYRDIIEVDEGLTLPKVVEILKVVDEILMGWLDHLATIPGLGARIGAIAAKLKSFAPSQMPTFEDIRDGKMDQEEFLREAFLFVVLSHLQGALSWLTQALDAMLRPVNPKDQHAVSVAMILETLGFNLQEADALEILDRNFDKIFQDAPA
ncbi:MAG TPA: hypothetical protein VHO67_03290 [Polyangia bacterium]|nr:hypothetical protein [Polyangia bacterium]